MARDLDWRLAGRLAVRDLRGGLSGFRVFVACLALGVGAIAAVGVMSDALKGGLAADGRVLLGGDISASRIHTRATPAERDKLNAAGTVSEIATMRSIARRVTQENDSGRKTAPAQTLVEVKAVDAAYPLAGEVTMERGSAFRDALAMPGSAVVAPFLLERLGLQLGDTFRLGSAILTISGVLAHEPDGLANRALFGPRIIISTGTLAQTELAGEGSLVRWTYRIRLAKPGANAREAASHADAKTLAARVTGLRNTLAPLGFGLRDRTRPAPRLQHAIDQLGQFLTLVGLATMLIGGIGVANAVSSYIDRKREVIATFRALGADARTVFAVYLCEIFLLAGLGIAIGLTVGVALPLLALTVFADQLPIPVVPTVSTATLAKAAAYGLLVALAFMLWPLGRVSQLRPALLFRQTSEPLARWPGWRIAVAIAVAAILFAGVALVGVHSPYLALGFLGGVAGLLIIFAALAWSIQWASARLPGIANTELRLALRGIAGPGALTHAVTLSLGTGLTLLVTVGLVDASLRNELAGRLPAAAPAFYFLDIKRDELASFRTLVAATSPGAKLKDAPMLRGRIISLKGVPAHEITATPDSQWVLNGDRGLTFADTLPSASRITAGAWWDKNYDGPPLVSFETDLARGLGLELGDTITVNILGRPIAARIANLRTVDWESLAINFVMIFSPNTLTGAPYNMLATLTLADGGTLAAEAAIARRVGEAFPSVTAIRVKDAIQTFERIFTRVMAAVRAIGTLTLLAGALVLAGAVTTAERRRTYQSVLLKTLGARRAQILRINLYEYAILAIAASTVAIACGVLAAWIVVTRVMDLTFVLAWSSIAVALATAIALVLGIGGWGLARVLDARPSGYLRAG